MGEKSDNACKTGSNNCVPAMDDGDRSQSSAPRRIPREAQRGPYCLAPGTYHNSKTKWAVCPCVRRGAEREYYLALGTPRKKRPCTLGPSRGGDSSDIVSHPWLVVNVRV